MSMVFRVVAFTLMIVFPAYGQSGYRPQGSLPSLAPENDGQRSGWRPTGNAPGSASGGNQQEPSRQNLPGEARYPLKIEALPGKPTEAEGLVAVIDRMVPHLNFTESYLARLPSIKQSNEIDRPLRMERERNRLEQLGAHGSFWLEGVIEIGDYDQKRGGFPTVDFESSLYDGNIKIVFYPAEQSDFDFMAIPLSEARIALTKIGNKRRLSVLIRARPIAAGDASPNANGIAATVYFKAERLVVFDRTSNSQATYVFADININSDDQNKVSRASAEEAVTPTGYAVLNQELVAMLLIKESQFVIPDAIYTQMMINRWTFEHMSVSDGMLENAWPSFFGSMKNAPNAVEIQKLLPSFKEWVRSRIEKLPGHIKISLQIDENTEDCTAFGPGAGFPSYNYNYIEAVVDEKNGNIILQNNLNSRHANYKNSNLYIYGDVYFKWPYQNIVYDNTTVESSTQLYCPDASGRRKVNWRQVTSHLPDNLKPSNYPVAVVRIPNWLERSDTAWAVKRFQLDAKIAQVQAISDRAGRPMLVIDLEPESLSALVKDPNVGKVERRHVAGKADFSALSAKAASAKPGNADASAGVRPTDRGGDILGVRPGMSPGEAEAALSNQLKIKDRYRFEPHNKNLVTAFTSGTLLVNEERTEYIFLIHDSRLEENKIMAVGRFSFAGPNKISDRDLVSNLVNKYGVSVQSRSYGTIYQSIVGDNAALNASQPCFLQLGALDKGSLKLVGETQGRVLDGAALLSNELRSLIGDIWSLPWIGFQDTYINDIKQLRGCYRTVLAWIPENSGFASGFIIWIADIKAYSSALLRLLNSTGQGDGVVPKL